MKRKFGFFTLFLMVGFTIYISIFCEAASKSDDENENFINEFEIVPSSSTPNDQDYSEKYLYEEEKKWSKKIKDDFGKKFDYLEYSVAQLIDIHSRLQWSSWIKQDFDEDCDYNKYSLKQLIDEHNRLQWAAWIKRDFGNDYFKSKYSAHQLRILYNSLKKQKDKK